MQAAAPIVVSLARTLCRDGGARTLRQAHHLSLADIGEAVGCAPTVVSRWERGINLPRAEAAARYGALLCDLMALDGAG